VYLDQGFQELLRQKMGRHANSLLTIKRAFETAKWFDDGTKRHFNPYDKDCEPEFEIPLVGVPDVPEIGLEYGYLRLKR
jgi:hypothetical protein